MGDDDITLITDVILCNSSTNAITVTTDDGRNPARKSYTSHYIREIPYRPERSKVFLFRYYPQNVNNGKRKSDNLLKWEIAHEFGHVLGIGDYYTSYRNQTFRSIMNRTYDPVTDADVSKLLEVIKKGEYVRW